MGLGGYGAAATPGMAETPAGAYAGAHSAGLVLLASVIPVCYWLGVGDSLQSVQQACGVYVRRSVYCAARLTTDIPLFCSTQLFRAIAAM